MRGPVEFAALAWVDWFNDRRLLEPAGNIPPAEAEARYYAQMEELAPAGICQISLHSASSGQASSKLPVLSDCLLRFVAHSFA